MIHKKPGGCEPRITRVQQESSLPVDFKASRKGHRTKKTYYVLGTVLTAFMDWLIESSLQEDTEAQRG